MPKRMFETFWVKNLRNSGTALGLSVSRPPGRWICYCLFFSGWTFCVATWKVAQEASQKAKAQLP